MSGETSLDKLLALMQPTLLSGEFVFCTSKHLVYGDLAELHPIASYQEDEGLSLILNKADADRADLDYNSVFKGISLSVHSSLDAVGFTAAVAGTLASNGISANVVAAHFHDHLFVPIDHAELALELLTEIRDKNGTTES